LGFPEHQDSVDYPLADAGGFVPQQSVKDIAFGFLAGVSSAAAVIGVKPLPYLLG
jgi:hypothetical protein